MKASMMIKRLSERIYKYGYDFDIKVCLYDDKNEVELEIEDVIPVLGDIDNKIVLIDCDVTETDKIKLHRVREECSKTQSL